MEEERAEKLFIRNISPGTRLTVFFIVRSSELRDYDGKPFLSMEIGDSTGRISASYWGDDAKEYSAILKEGSVVKLRSVIIERNGKAFMKIEKMRPAKEDEFQKTDFLPVANCSFDSLWEAYLTR
jgi:23S rRNA maturation-related 3'-5' exoribonuclease YhaM